MFVQLPHVRIDAVSAAVPAKELRLKDELEYYGGSLKRAERARTMIGTDRRRIAWPDITTADLCMAAAERLLRDQDADKNAIDALIFVSQSPEYDLPATACVLQHELGLAKSCATFDVNQGCAGYVYGLWLAANLISTRSCRRVLLLAGDACYVPRDPKNRVITPIFGDGGSATLLEWSEGATPLCFEIGTDGSGYDAIIVPGGRSRVHYSRDFSGNEPFFADICTEQGTPWRLNEVHMRGEAVFEFTLRVIPEHLRAFMRQTGASPETVDWLILHQANKQIVQNVASSAGFPPDKAPWETFSRYGNLSSASIPAVLCDLFGGQAAMPQQQLLLCGYGVGLSWASCLLQAEGLHCTPVIDVAAPRDGLTNAVRMERWTRRLAGEDIL